MYVDLLLQSFNISLLCFYSEVQVSQAGSKRSRKRRSAPGDLSSGPVGSGQAGGGGPATKRRLKQRRRKRANSNAVAPISRAPFNSTQFLMSDHQRGGEDSALEVLPIHFLMHTISSKDII